MQMYTHQSITYERKDSFPSNPHRSTPPCSCTAGQLPLCLFFLLTPSLSDCLMVLTIKKKKKEPPICPGEDIIAIMTAAALDITHSVLIVPQRTGQTLSAQCADATQYYHSVTTAHHTHSHYLSPFSPLTIPVIFPLSTEQT